MLNLEIVTPEKMVLSESVDSVTVPTASGEIGIMANHAPLISSLRAGILSYTRGGATEKMIISGGFVEVSSNNVSVLADIAEESGEIDSQATRAELAEAERTVKEWKGTEEELEAELEKLDRAQARLQLAGGK
jgi:F-type H+-transporting ATPase subunit epsilon